MRTLCAVRSYLPASQESIDEDLPEWYLAPVDTINARPMRFNVAPTEVMPVVGMNREGGTSIRELRWAWFLAGPRK